MLRISKLFFLSFLTVLFSCCSDDNGDYVEVTPVVLDITQVPYPKLSDYNFFSGDIKNLSPVYGVIPYKPTSELFTDYAIKKRFIWMPKDVKGTYIADHSILNLPVSSVLIKNFYYENVQPNNTTKIIETRLMIKKTEGWIFAEYIWNDEQTDAFLQTQSTETAITWLNSNNTPQTVNYKTPSVAADCTRCHGNINNSQNFPIGIKPQNLNSNYTYSDGSKNQLNKLVEFGYLEDNIPSNIVSVVNYKDATQSLDLRVRSYFDINCAHCHQDGGDADHFSLRFPFSLTSDFENMGVGVQAEHVLLGYNGRIVSSGNVAQSILHYRVNTETDQVYKMPALGRTIRETEAVQLVEDWINSL